MNVFEPSKPEKKKSLREEYDAKKLFAEDTMLISSKQYNATIGTAIAVGFAINFAMAYTLKSQILSIPIIGVIIAYFVMSLGGMFVVHKSSSAFVSAIGFLVLVVGMGLLLTFFLNEYSISSVYYAFGITAGITIATTILGTLFPTFFLSIGKTLGLTLIVTIIAELICTFVFPGALQVFDYLIILLFCGYIGFDWSRAQQYPKTLNNAINSAADLYIDIVNVLIRILEIVGKKD